MMPALPRQRPLASPAFASPSLPTINNNTSSIDIHHPIHPPRIEHGLVRFYRQSPDRGRRPPFSPDISRPHTTHRSAPCHPRQPARRKRETVRHSALCHPRQPARSTATCQTGTRSRVPLRAMPPPATCQTGMRRSAPFHAMPPLATCYAHGNLPDGNGYFSLHRDVAGAKMADWGGIA